MPLHTFQILAANIHAVNPSKVADEVFRRVTQGLGGTIHVCTVHTLLECYDHPDLAEIVNSGTLSVPDGMPLVWLVKRAFPEAGVERCYGPDLMLKICGAGVQRNVKHFLYGSTPEVLQSLSQTLSTKFPGIQIAGRISPPFRALTHQEETEIASEISESGADVVWVGLGTPRQDYWLGTFQEKLNRQVLIAVGAAFDFHAGRIQQAPRWMMRCGLEWLFRLICEPGRLWKRYLIGNPRFIYLLLRNRKR